jgi:ElaB/YqjD/DUF883 family membrane-anchored ribosome-binding protein
MVGPVNRGFGGLEQGHHAQESRPGGAGKSESGGVAGVVESVKEKAQDLASAAASRAEDAWDTARHGVQRAYSSVADTAENALDNVTDYMRRYPFLTLCVGFGLGFLVAQSFSFGRSQRY